MKHSLGKITRFAMKWLKRFSIAAVSCLLIGMITIAIAWQASPFSTEQLNNWPRSPRVTDRHGQTMLQLVGSDDQWRLPVSLDEISPWLVQATIAVEDQRFYDHVGVDPLAIARAIKQNVTNQRVVSGASTLSMQLCRMINPQPRNLKSKAIEAFRALQLEQQFTKDEIIEHYLNLAPYGGNVRGVEAASLVYFGKHASSLSLPEATLLAGLPQSPERFRPDRFPVAARKRRNNVLLRMVELGMISQTQASEASNMVIDIAPIRPQRLANTANISNASHAAWLALRQKPQGGQTTIDLHAHRDVNALVQNHMQQLPQGSNIAVTVINISTGQVRALIGSSNPSHPVDGQVNGAIAKRSPGSALKPFVFATAFESRRLNEESMLYDGPIERAGWAPKNFDGTFAGQVSVTHALQKSLNVPAIVTAEAVGLERCASIMRAAGVALPENVISRGGLAVVTGAVECDLLSLTNAYATLGRGGAFKPFIFFADRQNTTTRVLTPGTCAMLDDILSSWSRRPSGMEQLLLEDLPWFMWKTGTSAGRRDAWAIGHNGKVAIGVWIGRFAGSGDFQYVGSVAAEPLLAELFNLERWRAIAPPSPRVTWAVTNPLPQPTEQSPTLRITSPRHGTKLLAINGQAVIYLKANQSEGIRWFMNDTLLDTARLPRLTIEPGRHTIRIVKTDGQIAESRIEIR